MPTHLKLRQLEVFNALIEAGSVSRAAEKLNLSQPAVSVALSNFETELGFKLFHRAKGFFVPTSEAMLLHAEVEQGLFAVSRIKQRADDIRSGRAGGVCVASNGVLAINFLPKLVAEFQRENAGINIELRIHSSRRIAEWVGSQQIDIGLIDTPVPVGGIKSREFELECVCIMHKDDPLVEHKKITPEKIANRSVIGITGGYSVDRDLNKILQDAGVSVARNLSSYYFAIARNLVAQGNNIAIIDAINGKANLGDGVVWRPFRPTILSRVAIIVSCDQPLGQAASKLYAQLQHSLKHVSVPLPK